MIISVFYLHSREIVRFRSVSLTQCYDYSTFFTATFCGESFLNSRQQAIRDDTAVDSEGDSQKLDGGNHFGTLKQAAYCPQCF